MITWDDGVSLKMIVTLAFFLRSYYGFEFNLNVFQFFIKSLHSEAIMRLTQALRSGLEFGKLGNVRK